MIDTQDFFNLLWLAFGSLSLLILIGVSYSFGWKKGWTACQERYSAVDFRKKDL